MLGGAQPRARGVFQKDLQNLLEKGRTIRQEARKNDRIVTEGKVHFPAAKTVEAWNVRALCALVRRLRSKFGAKKPSGGCRRAQTFEVY